MKRGREKGVKREEREGGRDKEMERREEGREGW